MTFKGMDSISLRSGVRAKTLGLAFFCLRAVFQNRILWGVEDFQGLVIRNSKYASDRVAREAAPALMLFAESSPMPFINNIKAARADRREDR